MKKQKDFEILPSEIQLAKIESIKPTVINPNDSSYSFSSKDKENKQVN